MRKTSFGLGLSGSIVALIIAPVTLLLGFYGVITIFLSAFGVWFIFAAIVGFIGSILGFIGSAISKRRRSTAAGVLLLVGGMLCVFSIWGVFAAMLLVPSGVLAFIKDKNEQNEPQE